MIARKLTYLVIVAVLSGCSITARLFPIQGPLSKLSPLPVLQARVGGVMGYSGKISLMMPDSERCAGRWSVVAPSV